MAATDILVMLTSKTLICHAQLFTTASQVLALAVKHCNTLVCELALPYLGM